MIAYAHTLSGHRGPHVASEHPQLKPKPKFVNGEGIVVALAPQKQQIVAGAWRDQGLHGAHDDGLQDQSRSRSWTSVKPGDKVRFTIDTDARAITKIDKLAD